MCAMYTELMPSNKSDVLPCISALETSAFIIYTHKAVSHFFLQVSTRVGFVPQRISRCYTEIRERGTEAGGWGSVQGCLRKGAEREMWQWAELTQTTMVF